jgi:hypothetical protein
MPHRARSAANYGHDQMVRSRWRVFLFLHALSNYFSHNCEIPHGRVRCWGVWTL